MSKKISFTGNFWEYFFVSIGLIVLSVITLGIALPYYVYWSFKYFFTKLEIGNNNIAFTGDFWEYFFISLALLILSSLTFGIALPYYIYWSFKYFFAHLEPQPISSNR